MSLAAFGEKYRGFYTPRFTVGVGSTTFTESSGVISDLSVDTAVDRADRASFTLNYPFDHETGEFDGLDWTAFEPGVDLAVSMGYADELEPLFVGRIQSVEPTFPSGEGPTVRVSGYGLIHEMTRGTRSRSWDDATDSDVAREIASDHGFTDLTVESTDLERPKIIQQGQSDYSFLEGLAERNYFELFARRDAFEFGPPRQRSEPIATLRYGESLDSFSPTINRAEQVGTVVVRGWDPATREPIVGRAEHGESSAAGTRVLEIPVGSTEEANRIAEADLNRTLQGEVEGSAETVGLPEIQAGEWVRLEGTGERFTGNYYVESATHTLGASGYRTTFQITETPT
ncbi:phage late control D family protein [Salinigranum salinum]|uniref:phage late control D family protein n=1 Tax=Salinigranum salinum TaxID=1364937 RepID=UPI0012604485|nr:contractile injection system protein, VgrG/Pvc8 family [Salinigranum salinum]